MQKRKIYLINKGFQFRYIRFVVSMILVFITLVALNTVFFLNRNSVFFEETPAARAAILDNMTMLLFLLVLFGTCLILVALYYSHKVAGPLYRFEQILDSICDGNLAIRSSIRKGDELTEFQDALNCTISKLQNIIKNDRAKAVAAAADIKSLKEELRGTGGSSKDLEPLIKKLSSIQEEVGGLFGYFKI